MSTQDIKDQAARELFGIATYENWETFLNEMFRLNLPFLLDIRVDRCIELAQQSQSEYIEGLKAEIERLKAMLIKLRTTYITDLNPKGEPKPSIIEIITIWDEVNNLINP